MASVGLYGVMAQSVTQRGHEIGVRMALGASRVDIVKMVVGQGLSLVAIGGLLGLALSLAVTRLFTSQLVGVAAHDIGSFAGTAGVLAAVALLACGLPARRASRSDPSAALRTE